MPALSPFFNKEGKMSFDATQFEELVIKPALKGLPSRVVSNRNTIVLLLMIAAHESRLGTYVKQIKGPALGAFQMEPFTHDDLLKYLDRKSNEGNDWLALKQKLSEGGLHEDRLIYDLRYATQLARLYFWRISAPIPKADDFRGLAAYAKKYWNTELGAATVKDYEQAYFDFFPDQKPKQAAKKIVQKDA